MKISTRGQYGLEALVVLADNYSEGPVSLKTIAGQCDLSESYILQIFLALRKAGIVDSVRGAQGGYQLSYAPSEITVKQVLEALEGTLAPVACIVDDCSEPCINYEVCAARLLWQKVKERMDAVAESITLDALADCYRVIEAVRNPDYCI